MKTEQEKMLSGELYNAADEELYTAHRKAQRICAELNGDIDDNRRAELSKELLGKTGKTVVLTQGFYCDYGENIEVGENFYCNYGVCILDVCKVKIGANCLIGPQVGIYTVIRLCTRLNELCVSAVWSLENL